MMKTKPLFLTVVALAILAAAAYWFTGRDSNAHSSAEKFSPGDSLFDPAFIADITEIHLKGNPESETVLRKTENGWSLPGYFNLPVDFDKLKRLTDSLIDAKIDRFVTSHPESLERLDLGQKSISLQTTDKNSRTLAIGGRGQNGGNFIQIDSDEAAYLTRSSLSIDTNQNNWPQKQPLRLDESDIAGITLTIDGRELSFSRKEASDDFSGVNLTESENAKSREISSLIRTLLNARFTDAISPDDPEVLAAQDHLTPITLETFNELRYTLNIGRRPGSSKNISKNEKTNTQNREPVSASVVFDSDGNIIPAEELEKLKQDSDSSAETVAEADNTEPEEEQEPIEPGPVFIFYQSNDPNFIWGKLTEKTALKVGDHLFDRLPKNIESMVETVETETESD